MAPMMTSTTPSHVATLLGRLAHANAQLRALRRQALIAAFASIAGPALAVIGVVTEQAFFAWAVVGVFVFALGLSLITHRAIRAYTWQASQLCKTLVRTVPLAALEHVFDEVLRARVQARRIDPDRRR